MVRNGILVHMSRRFKTVDDDQALDLTVRLGDCLPPNQDTIANGVEREGDDLPDKLNRGGRRRGLDGSLPCLQAVSASFLAKPIGIFQPTEKLFIYVI